MLICMINYFVIISRNGSKSVLLSKMISENETLNSYMCEYLFEYMYNPQNQVCFEIKQQLLSMIASMIKSNQVLFKLTNTTFENDNEKNEISQKVSIFMKNIYNVMKNDRNSNSKMSIYQQITLFLDGVYKCISLVFGVTPSSEADEYHDSSGRKRICQDLCRQEASADLIVYYCRDSVDTQVYESIAPSNLSTHFLPCE